MVHPRKVVPSHRMHALMIGQPGFAAPAAKAKPQRGPGGKFVAAKPDPAG